MRLLITIYSLLALAAGAWVASMANAARHETEVVSCSVRVIALVDALSEIDGSLDVGVNIGEYRSAVTRASVAYAKVAWKKESASCVSRVGIFAERALNKYRAAYSVWSTCIDNLQQSDCTAGSVGEQVQRAWANAHANLQRAANA